MTMKNKDKLSEYQRKYMASLTPEKRKAIYKRQVNYAKKRREVLTIEEKEKKKEYMRMYYQKNKEKIQTYRKEKYDKNKTKLTIKSMKEE